METKPNQGGSSGGDSTMESVDWRTLLPPDTRQKLVNTIMENLKKHVQSSGQEKLHELKDAAVRLEERFYNAATSHADYMRKIGTKLMSMENRAANSMPNSLQSTSTCSTVNPSDSGPQDMQQLNNQGQPSLVSVSSNHPRAGQQLLSQSIHNNVSSSGVPPGSGISHSTSQISSMQNIQNISVGNNMGHGISPSNFVSQRQMPGSQNSQHLLYQIAKQKLQQTNIHNNINSTASVQPLIQQQHQNLLLPPHLQSVKLEGYEGFGITHPTMLQPSLSTLKQNRQPRFSQSGQPMSQHHQQMVLRQQRQQQQPRVFGQQCNLSYYSAIYKQHLGSQSSQKQQQSLETQSGISTMLNSQHSSHLMKSTQGQRSQMELSQQLIAQLQTQSAQFQHQLNMKQRLAASFHQQRDMPEASSTSSDSTAQTRNPNNGDGQEEVFQKVKAMKEKYFPELNDIYQKFIVRFQHHDSLPQQQNPEQVERLKKFKHMLECCMKFLQLPKNNISPNHKEHLAVYEKEIMNLITAHKRKPGPTLQQQQRMNSLDQSQQTQIHFTQIQPHENQMNSQLQSVNLQHTNLSSLHPQQNTMGMLPHQQLKQLQSRQMQQQLMHKQQLLHHHQFYTQTKHKLKLQTNLSSHPHPHLHQMNDVNEYKVRQHIDMKPESLKQLKTDPQNGLSCVTKSSTPLQPASSPFVASSPSTPSTSNLPGDTDKVKSSASLLSNDGNICTPGISVSPLLEECTNPDVNRANDASVASEKPNVIEQPLEHLLKVVKSISSKNLSDSIRDISSVAGMIDRIAAPTPNNRSRTAVGEDLVALRKATTRKRKAKHQMFIDVVSSPSRGNDCFSGLHYLEKSEVESTATSTIKRPRVKMSLMEEIREINEGLIDTVVEIDDDSAAALKVGKGTIVNCSFNAVALCPNLKSQFASAQMSSVQPLRLLVPANYPNCSPVLLDSLPLEISKEKKYEEEVSIKAKWRFSSCVRRLSEPMVLKELVRTWDVCVRTVILECVQQKCVDGGTFTSKYGAWEEEYPIPT